MDNSEKSGPVGIGAKGTIVSLMEKELQLESSKARKLPPLPAAQMNHLSIRAEVVSVYCGNLLIASNVKGGKNSHADFAAKNLTKSGSCKESSVTDTKGVSVPSLREALGRSSSLRETRSKELPSQTKILHFPSPRGTPRRKKMISYHDAASSGMFSFLDHDQDAPQEHKYLKQKPSVDDLIPILSPGQLKFHDKNISVPGKFSITPVEIVDTRCYRGGRELFRTLPKSSTSPKKLSFWRL